VKLIPFEELTAAFETLSQLFALGAEHASEGMRAIEGYCWKHYLVEWKEWV